MELVLLIVHVAAAAGVIGLVLLQQGKGADMGAAFGAGASATVFGSRGSASFMTRATAVVATVFFVTSISLAAFSRQNDVRNSVTEVPPVEQSVPEDMPTAPAGPQDVPTAQ